MNEDKILSYWESLTGLDKAGIGKIGKIEKQLIDITNSVYYEYYYNERSWLGISDYIRDDSLCAYIPFGLSQSDIDNDVKKKLMILMLEHSGKEYSCRKLPYHFMVNSITDDGKNIREWLRYLVREDTITPREIIFKNSREVMASKNVSDLERILYYFSLPAVLKNNAFFNEFTTDLLNSSLSEEIKTDIANLIMDPDELKEFLKEMTGMLIISGVKLGDIKFEDASFLGDLSDFELPVSKDLVSDFHKSLLSVYISDFEHTRRHVCKWMLSLLTLADKKKMIKEVLNEGDKHALFGVGDYLQFHGKEFDSRFLEGIIKEGINSAECDMRSLFYGLAFVLLDDIEGYVNHSLSDAAIKVRNTLSDVALSPYKYKEMDDERREKLLKYVLDKNVNLSKRQQGRMKKFKVKFKVE